LFQLAHGKPVCIQLIDSSPHTYLPQTMTEMADLAVDFGMDVKDVKRKISSYHETNPAMGLRGARFGLLCPKIIDMQVRAIFQAALYVSKTEESNTTWPTIVIPTVNSESELEHILKSIVGTMKKARFSCTDMFK
jgi:pyruvate,orthophosphate dikinase